MLQPLDIQLLDRKQINDQAWDNCIQQYANGLPYALSGYLDKVTGGKWEALVGNDYDFVFPLPFQKKLRLKFYVQPFLVQQLGLFGPDVSDQMVQVFLEKIPKRYAGFYLKFQEQVTLDQWSTFEIKPRTNLVLPLEREYENINAAYSKSLRKRIRQARAHYSFEPFDQPKNIVKYYEAQLEHRIQLGPQKYTLAKKLLQHLLAEKLGFGVAALNPKGKMEACLFLANYQGRIINLFGASNDSGKDHYAMHFLLDQVIEKYAGEKGCLDFEGSDIPGVQDFYKSFGAEKKMYLEYISENLPLWYRLLQRINNLLR